MSSTLWRLFALTVGALLLFPGAAYAQGGGGQTASQDLASDQKFVSDVFDDVQSMWVSWFNTQNLGTPHASGYFVVAPTNTSCGPVAPDTLNAFYCEPDDAVFVPMVTIRNALHGNFFGKISDPRLTNAAAAFVVAHEYGHNVHAELYARGVPMTVSPEIRSKPKELFADCAAGLWGNRAYRSGYFEPGDWVSIIAGVESLGDTGVGGPDPHGSAAERETAFRYGYDTGQPWLCADRYLGTRI
jgi:predicted metalloprotease